MKTKKCGNSTWAALASSQHRPPPYIPIAEARGITAISIIYDFFNTSDLNFIPAFCEHKPIWMYEIHGILPFTISMEGMTTPDMKFQKRFESIRSFDLSDALLKFHSHFLSILTYSNLRFRTRFFEASRSVFNLHDFLRFTFLVNLL